MINNEVVLENNWKDVQNLSGKLAKIIEARTKMQELTDIEYGEETKFIFNGYCVLGSEFDYMSEGDQRENIDEYFTKLFNEVIIEYVTEKKLETE